MYEAESPTTVAELTPPGRAAVAVVLVSGAGATELVDRCFSAANGRPLDEQRIGRICFGRWQPGGEELVVCRRDPFQVEVHCHGGHAAVAAIIDALVGQGATDVDWQTAIRQQSPDPIAAAARVALAEAPTLRTAQILLDQWHGALRAELLTILTAVRQGQPAEATARITTLIERAPLGRHLTRPWRVVLFGAPNVGKSSLINALLGYERAIVFDQPGTTRDAITATTALDGWPVEFADTAGLRDSGDALEQLGVSRTNEVLRDADLRLLVVDARDEIPDLAVEVDILVVNKIDLANFDCTPPRGKPFVTTSAISGEGLEQLTSAIVAALVPAPPAVGAAVPFAEAHLLALQRVLAALQQGTEPAVAALESLVARSEL